MSVRFLGISRYVVVLSVRFLGVSRYVGMLLIRSPSILEFHQLLAYLFIEISSEIEKSLRKYFCTLRKGANPPTVVSRPVPLERSAKVWARKAAPHAYCPTLSRSLKISRNRQ
ncbi:hypothetical protein Taro_040034 [Colocasia esculenta]|uniref:Uncharacterized protein n=1 Tax=Colocasia esculenta TaxID=4460 RepID=A0A843WI17_COLES|nr:hypothetical protein [Colocasia esculenta]